MHLKLLHILGVPIFILLTIDIEKLIEMSQTNILIHTNILIENLSTGSSVLTIQKLLSCNSNKKGTKK